MIQAENLTYIYTSERPDTGEEVELRAVDGVDLEIAEGEFVAVLGHNGSGKSTFAKLINGLLLPSEGSIRVAGLDTKNEENILKIRQTAGMVFQNPDNQIIGAVVEEDVGFGPENLQVETAEIWRRVDECLAAVGMTDYRNSSPNRLSGGQKQRVAIASVLAMQPKCIVLDEPTAMLDPVGRREVIDTAFRLNREKGVTIVLITHFMEEVVNADRVVIMDNGKVLAQGTPREIFAQYDKLKRIGLGVPEVTALSIELREAGVDIPIAFEADELVESLNAYRKRKKHGN